MSETRTVRFDHLVGVYAVGSGDWPWRDEYEKLINRPVTQKLMESVRADGIREPVLLGNDGRVWDGHHRIVVAMHLGLDQIPVEFSGGVVTEEPEWGTALRTPRGELWDFEPESSREDAEAHVRGCGHDEHMPDVCIVVSRTPGHEAGPWVPVEQGHDVDG